MRRAEAHVPSHTAHGMAMGFVRLTGGRTTLILDGGGAREGPQLDQCPRFDLAFEPLPGRRPLIVNAISASFGAEWRRAGRATPSHSTLCLERLSSSCLGVEKDGPALGRNWMEVPGTGLGAAEQTLDGMRVLAGHNGYAPTYADDAFARTAAVARRRRALGGEDSARRDDLGPDRRRFDQVSWSGRAYQGIDF
ncbi:MAG: heparinase II/III family protein [Paracoccaceae bacterium]